MHTGQSNSPSSGDQYPVYVGVWTNWSRGRFFGYTLTLNREDANLLIAFTAFFIAFVTIRVWRIVCFVFHRIYSTTEPRDAIYHQRQTIFRNSSSPEAGIQMLISLLWANRHSKGWLRPLPAAVVAILCISIFTIAGGFSSRISTAVGDEVLIKTSNCGFSRRDAVKSGREYFLAISHSATMVNSAATYAQQCYSDEHSGLLDCNRFVLQNVSKTIDGQASCPFKSHLCRNQSKNLRIDSGYLDSHDILGLNAAPEERILFRTVLQCAPLRTTGFMYKKKLPIGEYAFYQYGKSIASANDTLNWVHAAPVVEAQYAATESNDVYVTTANYELSIRGSGVTNQSTDIAHSEFVPIDDMFRKDADLALIFLSGDGVVFHEYSEDEWYNSNTNYTTIVLNSSTPTSEKFYLPKEPASPLGCTGQHQFCNAAFQGTSGCGPLASLRDAVAGASPFFNTTHADFANNSFKSKAAARYWYFVNMYFSNPPVTFDSVVDQLGATALTSQKSLYLGFQGPIASNQWQQDVAHWWDISRAVQQSLPLDQAYFPADSELNALRFNYSAPEFQQICSNQKIRTRAYASFSLFGLSLTAAVGLLLTLGSYLVEPISDWLHKRKGYNKYPHLEWTTNSTLQMQRLAHEELGFGTWSEGTETIPITKPGQLLGSLDISDPKHPVLRRPRDADDGSLSLESSNETPITVVGEGSEHTNGSLAPSDDTSEHPHEVNTVPLNDPIGDEQPIKGRQPNIETETELISSSPPSEQTAQPTNVKKIQIA